MKKILLLVLSVALVPALTGCLNMSSVVAQLKNDPATVDFNVATIYGSVTLHRAFPTNWVQPVQLTMPTAVATNAAPAK